MYIFTRLRHELIEYVQLAPNEYDTLLDNVKKQLENKLATAKDGQGKVPQMRNALHSYYVSKIFSNTDNPIYEESYLKYLLENTAERKLQRTFNRYFYGDINIDKMDWTFSDKIGNKGCDFYKTYNYCMYRLKQHFKSPEVDSNPLLAIELFTICDIIKNRLYQRKDGQDGDYFFYSTIKRYEELSNEIIADTKTCIQLYINAHNKLKYPFFTDYLESIKTLISNYEQRTISNSNILNSIKQCDSISSAYYIGLFYLPNKVEYQGYKKQNVLDMILLQSIQKYNDVSHLKTMFMQRTAKGEIEDNLYNSYALLKQEQDKNNIDINATIAQDLKKIQLIFEECQRSLDGGKKEDCKKSNILERKAELVHDVSKNVFTDIVDEICKFTESDELARI